MYAQNERQKKHAENQRVKADIDKLYDDTLNLSNEKIAIADTTYTLVDAAVKDLDDGLKKFEDQLKNSVGSDSKAKRTSIVQPLSKYQKDKRKKIHQEIEQSKEIFQIGAGQHEPVYCYCSKPSYGQM